MHTILLADDDQDLLEALDCYLSQNNYRVIRAKDGAETVSMASELGPDLILLDIMMPDVDGLTACRVIKNIEKTKEIPVIMLTARGEIDDVKAAFKAGANDYISKPFEMDQVRKKIEEFLGAKLNKKGSEIYVRSSGTVS